MTTGVDILFKEPLAPSQNRERVSRPDASPIGSDYGQDRSDVSRNKDEDRYEKTFSEHLDNNDTKNSHPLNQNQNKPSEIIHNGNQTNKTTQESVNASQPSAANNSTSDSSTTTDNKVQKGEVIEAATVVTKAAEIDNTAQNTAQNKVPNNSTKDLILGEVVSEKTVASAERTAVANNTKNEYIVVPDAGATKSSVTDIATNNVAKGQGAENQNNQNGVQNTQSNATGNTPKHSEVVTNNQIPTAQSNSESAQQATASVQSPVNPSQQPIDRVAQSGTAPGNEIDALVSKVQEGNKAAAPSESAHNNSGVSKAGTETLLAENKGNSEQIAMPANGTKTEGIPQQSDAVAVVKEETTKAPLMEKPAAEPQVVASENSKTLPFALVQNQNNAQNKSSSNKKGGASAVTASATKAKNTSTTAAANTQNSSSTTSLQSAMKSDIQFDLGIAGQKFDAALPQNATPNGQPNLLTGGGLLTAQDVNFQKTLSNLGATVKTDTSTNTKMINEQISVAISKNVVKGLNNFSIRLHPAELGQVDIRLEFMADGKMQAAMTVESEKTLTMLQRDQSTLEKALQDAGINLSNKNLNFSLMKQGNQNNGQKNAGYNGSADGETMQGELSDVVSMQEVRMGYSKQAIDISV